MSEAPDSPTPRPSAAPGGGRRRRQRAPGAYLNLPLWQRFVLASVVAIVLLTAMVIYVDGHNTNVNPILNEAAERRANHEAEILDAQDQAPHTLRVAAAQSPRIALERAIRARINSKIIAGAIDGPVQSSSCAPVARHGRRTAYDCTVLAGDVKYPFVAVADSARRSVTYCKHDPPPTPSDSIPVSSSCRL